MSETLVASKTSTPYEGEIAVFSPTLIPDHLQQMFADSQKLAAPGNEVWTEVEAIDDESLLVLSPGNYSIVPDEDRPGIFLVSSLVDGEPTVTALVTGFALRAAAKRIRQTRQGVKDLQVPMIKLRRR